MEVHLEANDLWEAVEEDYEVLPLLANPTMTQIKTHKERKSRKSKARALLFFIRGKEMNEEKAVTEVQLQHSSLLWLLQTPSFSLRNSNLLLGKGLPLPRSKFEFLREKLGVCNNQSKEEC
ncbi:hypothetical protein CR513_54308, partial [Mucuna pruriens]